MFQSIRLHRRHPALMLKYARVDQRAHLTECRAASQNSLSIADVVRANVYVLADDPELSLDSRSVY